MPFDPVTAPTDDMNRPAAVIYAHSLMPGSTTFIKSHAEGLRRYRAVYAGAHRENGIPLPEERTFVVNSNGLLGLCREALFRRFGWAPWLVESLRKQNPAVVHAHFGDCGPAGMTLANKLRVPLIVTFHGHDATTNPEHAGKSYRGRELARMKSRLIEFTGAFIAVSDYIRRCLIAQGYPEEKVLLHRNGIDLRFFSPPRDIERGPIVLFVGRFVEKKGAIHLIEAARILRDAGVTFELVLIGSGPLEKDLKRAAESARIPCRFTGFLSSEEIRDWLARARVVAVPSVTAANGDSEGLPTILLEAQAMETPIVATRHSGIPEGVREGITAELVPEGDAPSLAQQLRSFLDSPSKAREFGKAGRKFVHENFDLATQVAGLEELYTQVQMAEPSLRKI